jgi:RHS repeat-associated protein
MLEELGRTWKKRYAYDAANRQKDIELTRMSDGRAEYFRQSNCYDAEGLRYETKEDGNVSRFLFDRGELAEEIREDAHIRYTRGYDPLSLTWNGTEKSYFVPDEMGSTLFLLDKDHEILKTYRYDAFGAILNESGDTFNRLTYTGQMYDGAMGQYYLRARFYNPSIGRFMQEDVYRGDGLNLYAYCANNPVMYFDPSGFVHLCVNGKTVSQLETYEEVQYYRRLSKTPKIDSPLGQWTGDRGESKFIPSDPKMKAFLKQYGLDGITYKNGVPDFTPFAETQVTLFNMHGGDYGRKFNFPEADKLAGPGHTLADIEATKGIKYTWHECNDMKTMQLIPFDINDYFDHFGGVGEINLYFELFNPNQTWWFRSWQKK